MTTAFPWLAAAVLAIGTGCPALALDEVPGSSGFWSVGPTPDDQSCDMEFLPAIAHEFEGVWHVARPLHYEDNRAACRRLGIEGVVAWTMPEAGDAVWVLAEGDAGLMEFAPGSDGRWTITRSGHAALPPLVLEKLPGPPLE